MMSSTTAEKPFCSHASCASAQVPTTSGTKPCNRRPVHNPSASEASSSTTNIRILISF